MSGYRRWRRVSAGLCPVICIAMKQQRLVVLFCIAFTVFSAVFAAETGIKATFTQKGLNYLKDVGVAQILKELQVIDIPDLDGTTGNLVATTDFHLFQILLLDTLNIFSIT